MSAILKRQQYGFDRNSPSMRIWFPLWLSLGLLCSAAPSEHSYNSSIVFEDVEPRVNLSSNHSNAIYRELRDPKIFTHLMTGNGTPEDTVTADLLFGSDDESQYSVSIHFLPPTPQKAPRKIIDQVLSYVHMRWLGVSKDAALYLVDAAILPAPEEPNPRALLRVAPWLRYAHFRPVRPDESISVYWLGKDNGVVFVDSAISFVLILDKNKENGILIKVDSQEFDRDRARTIRRAAKAAWTKVDAAMGKHSPHAGILFWRTLKKDLGKIGFQWKTPEELNPGIIW